jgi:uncharacterized protein YdcH (DUF465 family)
MLQTKTPHFVLIWRRKHQVKKALNSAKALEPETAQPMQKQTLQIKEILSWNALAGGKNHWKAQKTSHAAQ